MVVLLCLIKWIKLKSLKSSPNIRVSDEVNFMNYLQIRNMGQISTIYNKFYIHIVIIIGTKPTI